MNSIDQRPGVDADASATAAEHYPRGSGRRGALIVAMVAALGLALTLLGTALSHAGARQAEAARRAEIGFAVRSLLQGDLLALFNQISGFAAWVEETGLDDPLGFQTYYDRISAPMATVPWRAVAVARVLPRAQLPELLTQLEDRRESYVAARYPALSVFPLSDADPAMPVLMVEPRDSRARVFGFDMGSETQRRTAANRALTSGRPQLTPPIALSQDSYDGPDTAPRSSLIMAPLRRPRPPDDDELGLVVFSFTPAQLIANAIARSSEQDLSYRLSIEAGTHEGEDLLSDGAAVEVQEVSPQLLRVHLVEQHWNIELDFGTTAGGAVSTQTLIVFLLGLLATGLAMALTLRITNDQRRLEATLAVRTRELEQTRDTIADAHRIDALGRLTGGVAHDFNNLLGVISGNLDLLRDALPSQADNETREFIDDAIQATDRGARLTQKLLTLSRQASLRSEPLDVDDVIRDMAGVLKRTLPATIEINTRIGDNLPQVRADRVQLESALLNLAINARDAMPDGGRLTLAATTIDAVTETATATADAPPCWVEISVTDTGAGMSPETARRALDPFFTTKEVGKGTGLGLAIVAGFVTQSGGDVKVDSMQGQGTSIRLSFPTLTAHHQVDIEDAQEWTPVARGGEVLVVIEDNAELRLVLDRQLRALGYQVLCADDGSAGLAAVARAGRVDLVLSDCVLPGEHDGYAVARILAERSPELPVLLMSGYAAPPEPGLGPESSTPLPIRLTKPLKRAELARAVRAAIDKRQRR